MTELLSVESINGVSPSLVRLFIEQQERRLLVDPRLPRFTESLLERILVEATLSQEIFVAKEGGNPIGIAIPEVVIHPDDSDMLTYWPSIKGTTKELVLCATRSYEPELVLDALLSSLEVYWLEKRCNGLSIIWPSKDVDIANGLQQRGFAIDGYLAYRGVNSTNDGGLVEQDGLRTRFAAPEDEAAVVDIYLEVISAHIPSSPFARHAAGEIPKFQQRLRRVWQGERPDDGASMVVVVEAQDEILGMAECWISVLDGETTLWPLPPGRYGYVNSFGVRAAARRRGAGALLEAAVSQEFRGLEMEGSYLWFNARNKPAARFWLSKGYEPLWTGFQRRT